MRNRIKRFVIITQDYYPDIGGITTWCHEIASYIRRQGYEVRIITKSFDTYDGNEEVDISVTRLDHRRWLNMKYRLIYKEIKALINDETAFICANWKMAFPCALHSLFRKINFITAVHGLDAIEGRKINKRLRDFALNRSKAVVAVSSYTAGLLKSEGCDPGQRLKIINNGVNTDVFKRTGRSEDIEKKYGLKEGPRILSLGRLVERKGFDMGIKAMAILGDQDAHYYIAGKGKYEKKLKELVARLELEDRVHFLGFVPDEDIAALYNSVDIFLMPARVLKQDVEGFGITYLEAAACGVPSIAGVGSGAEDAVVHKETGLLVDPESPGRIAEAIDKLLSEPELLEKMGNIAMTRAREEFSWNRKAGEILELFK